MKEKKRSQRSKDKFKRGPLVCATFLGALLAVSFAVPLIAAGGVDSEQVAF